MSARVRALPRRSKPSLAGRVRTFWVVALLAVAVLVALAAVVVNAPQLRVRAVDAVVPSGPVAKSLVLAAAHVDLDSNIWLLDTGAIRARLERIPYVANATVQRAQFPQPAVTLQIALRRPSACVRSLRGSVTIDATARVLQPQCVSGALPVIDIGALPAAVPGATLTGSEVERLLADAKLIGEREPVRIVRRDRFGGLEAVDERGVLLQFGSDADLAAKLALVEPVRAGAAGGRPIRAIDLRAPGTPIVEFP